MGKLDNDEKDWTRRRKEKIRDGCFFYFLPQCSYSGFLQGNNDDDEGEDEEEGEEAEDDDDE